MKLFKGAKCKCSHGLKSHKKTFFGSRTDCDNCNCNSYGTSSNADTKITLITVLALITVMSMASITLYTTSANTLNEIYYDENEIAHFTSEHYQVMFSLLSIGLMILIFIEFAFELYFNLKREDRN